MNHTASALRFPAITVSVLLAACGGGSQNSAPAPAPAPAPAQLQITAANQDAVARAAANIVVNAAATGAVAPLSTSERVTASGAPKRGATVAPSLAGATGVSGVLQRFAEYAVRMRGGSAAATSTDKLHALAVLRQTEACGLSGNVTITIDDADNGGTLSAGDSVSFSFNACRSGTGETIDGGLALSVAGASGANVSGTLSFTELTTSTVDASFAISGSVGLAYSELGSLATYQTVVGAGGLTTLVTAPMFSDAITLRAGFEQVVTSDSAALAPGSTMRGLNTARVNGTMSATSLGGAVTLATPTTFERYAVDPYPRAGQLQALGAAGSRVQLTTLSVTTVRIELDANGDGVYEQTRDVAWSALI